MRAQIQTHVGPTRRERIAATLAVAGHKASLTRTHGIFQSTKTQGKAQAVRPSPLHEETARSSRADFLPRSSAAIGLKVYTFVTAIMVTSSSVEATISLPILFKQPHSVTFRQFFLPGAGRFANVRERNPQLPSQRFPQPTRQRRREHNAKPQQARGGNKRAEAII